MIELAVASTLPGLQSIANRKFLVNGHNNIHSTQHRAQSRIAFLEAEGNHTIK